MARAAEPTDVSSTSRPRAAAAALAIGWVTACLLLTLPTIALAETPTPVTESAAGPGEFRALVDVGSRQLDLSCTGAAGPVVVFENALGTTMDEWDAVVPAVSRLARACRYDRAGTGRSTVEDGPRTSQSAVDDLRALLGKVGLRGPVILVGHDVGGLDARLFAREHPAEVLGLVLVDATSEEQEMRLAPIVPAQYREGVLIPRANLEHFDPDASFAEVRRAPPLGPLPVVVLTHGQYTSSTPPDMPSDVPERLEAAWRALQYDLAPGARHVVANKSGHNIQRDEPDLVVEAVQCVIAQAGGGARPRRLPSGGQPGAGALALAGATAVGLGLLIRRRAADSQSPADAACRAPSATRHRTGTGRSGPSTR
jgi:pimeloyl-ACP methyl ester carboxylesterase